MFPQFGEPEVPWLVRNGLWVGLIGVVLILALLFAWQRRGFRKRRGQFLQRTPLAVDEWFANFYPIASEDREAVIEFLSVLGREIGIQWTQLRPEDTFEDAILIESRYAYWEDLEEVNLYLADLAAKSSIPHDALPSFDGRLEMFLDSVVALRRRGG